MLDSNLNIVASELVRFDSDLPHYKTKDGVYRDPSGNGRIVSPTLMWLEALDLMLQKLSKPNFDFAKVAAVSGSGQQHGSVYWILRGHCWISLKMLFPLRNPQFGWTVAPLLSVGL